MVQINFANKEIQCKIVYYGPGMSGKTTNLEVVHKKAPTNSKGELTSIATEGDRTLFFDFMPLDLGNIAGIKTKFQLYTVPGQVYYNSTRKLVLQGVDGVVFVADSQAEKMEDNYESLENLKANLLEYGRDIESIPVILQWNKRDLPTALPVEELEAKLNTFNAPTFEAVAATGEGVFPTLKALASLVLESINRDKKESSLSSTRVVTAGATAVASTRTAGGGTTAVRPAAAATATRRPAARTTGAPPPAERPARPSARTQRKVEPATRTSGRPMGKVTIKEQTDSSRLIMTLVIAAVILGAGAFAAWKFFGS